ncbi:MAG: PAS domain S-box protein [Bdellovibrionia bacterium]
MSFNKWLPELFCSILLILAAFLFSIMLRQDHNRISNINELNAKNLVSEAMSEINHFNFSFNRIARRWEAGGYKDPRVWDNDMINYLSDTKGLKAINFVDENFIIRKIYPVVGNEKTLNYDLKTIPHAKAALERALENGKVSTTSIIELIAGGKGFVLYFPVYKEGRNQGFVSGVFDISRIFSGSDYFDNYNVNIKSAGHVIYEIKNYSDNELSKLKIEITEPTQFGDSWSFIIKPSQKYLNNLASSLPYLVLFVSLIVIGMIYYIIQLYLKLRDKEFLARTLLDWQQLVINSSSLMFVSVDEKGIIRSTNAPVTHILGYTEHELIGKKTPEVWHLPAEVKAFRDLLERKYEVRLENDFDAFLYESRIGVRNKNEFSFLAKDGSIINGLLEVHCIRNERNQVKGYVGIIEDITLRKQQEQKIKEQEAQVINSTQLASLGEMAAGIGHEINNPLAIIAANVAILKRKGEFTPELLERVEKIESTTKRIASIVRGLRSLSRQSHEHDRPELVKAVDVVMDAVHICSERVKNGNVQLEIENIPSDIFITCYPYQISQVILNLINNAFDAVSAEVQENKWIKVGVQKWSKGVIFYVHYSGTSLTPELRAKLFEPFFTTKEVGKGLGLGLSISLSIAKRHGGRLYIDPDYKTTCFKLEIPSVANSHDHH